MKENAKKVIALGTILLVGAMFLFTSCATQGGGGFSVPAPSENSPITLTAQTVAVAAIDRYPQARPAIVTMNVALSNAVASGSINFNSLTATLSDLGVGPQNLQNILPAGSAQVLFADLNGVVAQLDASNTNLVNGINNTNILNGLTDVYYGFSNAVSWTHN